MKPRIELPVERIEHRILLVRGHKVLLDADLAALYGVATRRLNEQVKRNRQRFPEDFVFRLSAAETRALDRSQFATGSQKHRDPRFAPYGFTEHGTIMAAMVLNSPRATEVSVYVVRAFVRLRDFLATHKDLAHRLEAHEKKLASHDQAIAGLVDTIRTLMASAEPRRRPIGFVVTDDKKRS
jgi:hypothetical protein